MSPKHAHLRRLRAKGQHQDGHQIASARKIVRIGALVSSFFPTGHIKPLSQRRDRLSADRSIVSLDFGLNASPQGRCKRERSGLILSAGSDKKNDARLRLRGLIGLDGIF